MEESKQRIALIIDDQRDVNETLANSVGALAPGWEGVGKSDPADGWSGARW